MLWRMLMCVEWEHCLPLATGATSSALNTFSEAFTLSGPVHLLMMIISTNVYDGRRETGCFTVASSDHHFGTNLIYLMTMEVFRGDLILFSSPGRTAFFLLLILQPSSLDVSRCLWVLHSRHPTIALHYALVSVWPTSSSASAQRGPVGPQKEATPAACVSAPLRRPSAHNTTLLLLQLAAVLPPSPRNVRLHTHQKAHTLEVQLGTGAAPTLLSDQTLRSRTLTLPYSLSLRVAGGSGLSQREQWGTVNMCV